MMAISRPGRSRPAAALRGGACALAALLAGAGLWVTAAKAADAVPDISGVWLIQNSFGFENLPAGARETPPLTPEYAARYAQEPKEQAKLIDKHYDDLLACIPDGMPRLMLSPTHPIEILQTPGRVTMLHEYQRQTRRIHTDGRGHPAKLEPTYAGDSVGHWEGDALVVETIGVRDDTNLDVTRVPHSDAMRVVERIRRIDHDTLQDEITVHDAKALTRPWATVKTYKFLPDGVVAERARGATCGVDNHQPAVAAAK